MSQRKSHKTEFVFKRLSLIKFGIAAAITAPVYTAMSAYSKSQESQRDLSVIEGGTPTLIQVHDETCPSCRKLLSSVKEVIHEFPEVNFKIADLKRHKGIKFAGTHQVSKVTLMYFNSQGKKIDVVAGLQSENEVRSFLNRMTSN